MDNRLKLFVLNLPLVIWNVLQLPFYWLKKALFRNLWRQLADVKVGTEFQLENESLPYTVKEKRGFYTVCFTSLLKEKKIHSSRWVKTIF